MVGFKQGWQKGRGGGRYHCPRPQPDPLFNPRPLTNLHREFFLYHSIPVPNGERESPQEIGAPIPEKIPKPPTLSGRIGSDEIVIPSFKASPLTKSIYVAFLVKRIREINIQANLLRFSFSIIKLLRMMNLLDTKQPRALAAQKSIDRPIEKSSLAKRLK